MAGKRKSGGAAADKGGKSQKSLALPAIPADSKHLPHIQLFEEWLKFGWN